MSRGFDLKNIWIIGSLILLLLLSGCAAPPPEETAVILPMTATIMNENFAFNPQVSVIARGGTVTWIQKDSDKHTVTGSGFDSSELSQGQTFNYTFNKVGVYEYGCKLHPSMKGKIIVK